MKKKYPEEWGRFVQIAKQQFNKLKHSKDKRWLLLIPIFIPLFCNPLLLLGIICLAIYLICNYSKKQ
ncbi:MAG: hypothetical protein PHV82_13805 [Victivallaceae bacterium]|nr:hypothetical protein [Victivallaceae bacterium]